MSNKNDNLFGDLATPTRERTVPTRKKVMTSGLVETRKNMLSNIASGEVEEKTFLWVLPERCRLWERHNRQYDLLTEERCQDLIDGFKSQGKQEIPAIVRRVTDDPNYDFEVICGARRHWTVTHLRKNNYTQFKFLVDARELDDEAAFRLSDIENRDKDDISDYERACDYRSALDFYYGGVQQKMADRLEVSKDWLSRFIYLADFPAQVVSAYSSIFEIKAAHVRILKPLLEDRKKNQKVLNRAEELIEEQAQRRAQGHDPIKGAMVIKALLAATKNKPKPKKSVSGALAEFEENGRKVLTVDAKSKDKIRLTLHTDKGITKEDLVKACNEAIAKFA